MDPTKITNVTLITTKLPLSNTTNATFVTEVNAQNGLAFSVITILGLILFFIIACCYCCCEKKILWLNHQRSGIFFVGIGITSFIATILYQSEDVYFSSVIILLGLSIVFIVAAFFSLFEKRKSSESNGEMSKDFIPTSYYVLPIFLITFCLFVGEITYMVAVLMDKDKNDHIDNKREAVLFFLASLQKWSQTIMYYFLTRKDRMWPCRCCPSSCCKEWIRKPKADKLRGVSWFYKTVSFINFIFWIESMKVTKHRQEEKDLKDILGGAHGIFTAVYTSLIVDYRLTFCTLFLEHALNIDKLIEERRGRKEEGRDQNDLLDPENRKESQNKLNSPSEDSTRITKWGNWGIGFGIGFGLALAGLQVLILLEYTRKLKRGPSIDAVACLAIWSFIIVGSILWWLLSKKVTSSL